MNVHVQRSKSDWETMSLVKDLPCNSIEESCPMIVLREWLKASEEEMSGSIEGNSAASTGASRLARAQ